MTEHSEYYYDYDRNDPSRENPFTLSVDDDGILNLPDDVMEDLGWKEGDELEWIDNNDGSFSLKKYEKTDD
jgi:bifunctional DNA-binding transcriptional regulator/antitoxin component of YhaV-PrlF toxin-antitoxin module